MASKTVPVNQMGPALNDMLKRFDKLNRAQINKGIKKAIVVTWGSVIEETPIGIIETAKHQIGQTKGSWLVGKSPTKRLGMANKQKNRNYVKRFFPDDILKVKRYFLYNNSENINMLEFGGYVKNPKFGTFNKLTGMFEVRSINGFSKQAPRGMLRKNMLRWRKNLKQSFRSL